MRFFACSVRLEFAACIGVVAYAWLAIPAHGADPVLSAVCKLDQTRQPAAIACALRSSEPGAVKSVRAIAGTETTPREAEFAPFDPANNSSAWLFVIDRSDPRRAATVRKSAEAAVKLSAPREGKRRFGLATFANDLEILAPLNASKEDFEKAAANVKAAGLATELYRAALDAIKALDNDGADRKALVIMSDGKAEDTAYKHEDVIPAAKRSNVLLYTIGYAETPGDTPALQTLRKLAQDTNGVFVAARSADKELPPEIFANFIAQLENGGTAFIKTDGLSAPSADLSLTAEFTDGRTATTRATVDLSQLPPPPPPPPAPEPQPQPRALDTPPPAPEPPQGFLTRTVQWIKDNKVIAGWAAAAGLLLLVLLAWFGVRAANRRAETRAAEAEAQRPSQKGPIYAWLEFLDGDASRIPIRATSVRIGRHKDNDICLANKTVHRRHAILHLTTDRRFVITDLETENGVYVNEVREGKKELADGDMIELGEVRLRYYSNADAMG